RNVWSTEIPEHASSMRSARCMCASATCLSLSLSLSLVRPSPSPLLSSSPFPSLSLSLPLSLSVPFDSLFLPSPSLLFSLSLSLSLSWFPLEAPSLLRRPHHRGAAVKAGPAALLEGRHGAGAPRGRAHRTTPRPLRGGDTPRSEAESRSRGPGVC